MGCLTNLKVTELAPNQVVVTTDEGSVFMSYGTRIAIKYNTGSIVLYPKWKYSKTTSKYRNIFLGEGTKDTEQKLASGEYFSCKS